MGALLGGLCAGLPGPGVREARAEDDLEPAPRWTFFATPDDDTARLIEDLVGSSFADLNKVVGARDLLVRRFGAWSVPALERELRQGLNDSGVLNAALSVPALRERLGPAPELLPLLRPLVERARDKEAWRRAAALLALGAFHGPEGLGAPRAFADRTLVSDPVEEARRLFKSEALGLMAAGLSDPNMPVRVAAALALGKTGGRAARDRLLESPREEGVESRMSWNLALGLLPEQDAFDQDRFVRGLEHEQTEVRASAALGAALQAVSDAPPEWVNRPDALLKAFASAAMSTGKRDTAEAVFARGCLAAHHQRLDEWEGVFAVAVAPRIELQVSVAASQVLLWCDVPLVRARALAQLSGNRRGLHDPVLAGFLLRAGYDGTAEGVRLCREWLGSPSLSPAAERDWDVRWHAVVGLVRAFVDGRLAGPEARKAAVEALEAAAERGLARDCALLPALSAFLERHRDRLLASPDHRPGDDDLRELEAVAPCRHGLFARSLAESAVGRANALLAESILGLTGLAGLSAATKDKDKDGNSKRFVERCLTAWPYLGRLDVLHERGRRPPEALRFDDALKVLDR